MKTQDKKTLRKLLIILGVWLATTLAKIGIEKRQIIVRFDNWIGRDIKMLSLFPNITFTWFYDQVLNCGQFSIQIELWICCIRIYFEKNEKIKNVG